MTSETSQQSEPSAPAEPGLEKFAHTPLTDRFELILPTGSKADLIELMKAENKKLPPRLRYASLAQFMRRKIGLPR